SACFASAGFSSAGFASIGFVTRTAVRTNTRLPQTTGVEEAEPAIGNFHFTFLFSLHSSGGSASGATPLASGPRHCGQLRRASGEGSAALAARKASRTAKSPVEEHAIFIKG